MRQLVTELLGDMFRRDVPTRVRLRATGVVLCTLVLEGIAIYGAAVGDMGLAAFALGVLWCSIITGLVLSLD